MVPHVGIISDHRRIAFPLRHPPNESARVLILDQCQSDTDMTAAHFWTSEVFRDFVHTNVAMNDLEKELQRAL